MTKPLLRIIGAVLVALLGVAPSGLIQAHGFELAQLDIVEIERSTYLVRWRPRLAIEAGEMALFQELSLDLPEHCHREPLGQAATAAESPTNTAEPTPSSFECLEDALAEAAAISRTPDGGEAFVAHCHGGGLEGSEIGIGGLAVNRMEAVVSISYAGAPVYRAILGNDQETFQVPAKPSTIGLVQTFLTAGIEHILSGWDHLLFVLLAMLLVTGLGARVAAITSFSLGHSLSLASATLGWITIPARPVEILIAWTLVFAAYETVRRRRGGERHRHNLWLLMGSVGLIHGLGFAGALAQIGIVQEAIFWPLLSFNLGVELGQLLVVVILVSTVLATQSLAPSTPAWNRFRQRSLPLAMAYTAGALAMYWMIERLALV